MIEGGLFSRNYPSVKFDKARDFWTTNENGQGHGRGIAEFTVHNFVSVGHNFSLSPSAPPNSDLEPIYILAHQDYPSPSGVDANVHVIDIQDSNIQERFNISIDAALHSLSPTTPLAGKLYFVDTPVTDTYYPTLSGRNPFTSTYSIYDPDLDHNNLEVENLIPHAPEQFCHGPNSGFQPCTTQGLFSLNRINYDAARDFLLPRAIAYSAGMIDYFFRGKMELCNADSTNSYIVKNLHPTEDMRGIFTLYYDTDTGTRVPLGQWNTEENHLLPDEAHGWLGHDGGEFQITATAPASANRDTFLLVFTGDMGNEVAPRDDQNRVLPGGAVVAVKLDRTKHCRGVLWTAMPATTRVASYNYPAGSAFAPVVSVDANGVAVDPRDGNLWYTASDGVLRKMQPDGSPLPIAITVTGTRLRSDGSPDQAVGAVVVDPIDPQYVWILGSLIGFGGYGSYVYGIRTTDGDGQLAGQVFHSCPLGYGLPADISGGTALTAAVADGRTHLVAVASALPQYIVVIDTGTRPAWGCGAAATYNPFYDPFTGESSAGITALEANGLELLAVVEKLDGALSLYSLGNIRRGAPTAAQVPVTELFSLPGSINDPITDLALGSSFTPTP